MHYRWYIFTFIFSRYTIEEEEFAVTLDTHHRYKYQKQSSILKQVTPLKMHFRLSLIIIRAFVGVNYSLCYFDNHYSTGELFPPIPMFRLKIYSRTERKLNCLPLRGQV